MCAERLLVDLVASFSRGQDVHLRYPLAVRPWQHVLDCLAGYLTLTDALLTGSQAGEAFNFGPGAEALVPVGSVAKTAAFLWGGEVGIVIDAQPEHAEAELLSLDVSKAQGRLGWRGRLDFARSMDWTIDWAKRDLRRRPAGAVRRATGGLHPVAGAESALADNGRRHNGLARPEAGWRLAPRSLRHAAR